MRNENSSFSIANQDCLASAIGCLSHCTGTPKSKDFAGSGATAPGPKNEVFLKK